MFKSNDFWRFNVPSAWPPFTFHLSNALWAGYWDWEMLWIINRLKRLKDDGNRHVLFFKDMFYLCYLVVLLQRFVLFIFVYVMLFMLNAVWQKERRGKARGRQRALSSTGSLPKFQQCLGLVQVNTGAWNSIWVSHVDSWDSVPPKLSLNALPRALVCNWLRRGAAGIWASTWIRVASIASGILTH